MFLRGVIMANYGLRKVLNFLGFIATMLIGIAMILAMIVNGVNGGTITGLNLRGATAAEIIVFVANIFAYFITIIAGFSYARSKRSVGFMIAQIVATLVIVVLVVLCNVI